MQDSARADRGLDRKAEELILGILELISGVLRTAFDGVFRPRRFLRRIANQLGTENGTQDPQDYVSPMSYLVICAVICSCYGYWVTKTPVAGELLMRSRLFDPFREALHFVWDKCKDLDPGKLVLLMLPVVIGAMCFASAISFVCRVVGWPSRNGIMRIACYTAGTYLLLHSLLFSYSLVVVNLFAKFHASSTNATIDYVFFGLHITICIAILWVAVTFLRGLTMVLECSFWQAAAVAILGALLVVAVFVPVACIVFPYLLNT